MTRANVLKRTFPTPVSLFRWMVQTRRRVACLVVALLALVTGPPLWWAVQLIGLPDVGDPFDAAAFRAATIPDDQNAFVLYDKAADLLKPSGPYLKASQNHQGQLLARWPEADPSVRRWVEDNRKALALYRQAAERPDALDRASAWGAESFKMLRALVPFQFMGMLEASRLEDQGDMAEAWGWYRAMVRAIHHVAMRSPVEQRSQFKHWHKELRDRITIWAADPRTTPAQLRTALDDMFACEALVPSEADSIKAAYLDVMELLDRPENPGRDAPFTRSSQFYHPEYQLTPEQVQSIWDSWRFWRREPERSRRVIRLITANWLAFHALPVGKRPKPEFDVTAFEVYPLGPESPAQARALSPLALEAWFDTAYDAQKSLQFLNTRGVRTVEEANHGELLVLLATELYRRDHGADPPKPEALVGPYLKSLPAELRAEP